MHSEPPSPVSPSPMTQLLKQLALDDLPPTILSDGSLDSSTKTLTEEPESSGSSPTRVDFPSLLASSRDSTLTAESAASSSGTSREGSCTIPAGPTRSASTASLHKTVETLPTPPVPQYDPIRNYPRPLHVSASSPALHKGTSILRSSSYTDRSAPASSNPSSPPSPTGPGTPSVKFAPLPEIERPKKRKRNQTLGVAARSQMLARRRQMMHDNEDPDRPPKHLWSNDDDEGEDPLITLGHMVKIASIGIWRKVVLRDRKVRSDMRERSNSDSVLEVTRSMTYADDEDENLVLADEPEDMGDDKPSPPRTEMIAKTVDDETVAVRTPAVSTIPVLTEEQ